MEFKKHLEIKDKHAFLSASKYHWVNYTDEQLTQKYKSFYATLKGTELHELACNCIRLGVRLPKTKNTLNLYVNDAINYRMTPEQPLFYSANCFGTADSICFRKDMLRIHDLKTGASPTSFNQLMIYAALFCLEYNKDPMSMKTELRIYQNNEVGILVPEQEDIGIIMEKIVHFDELIEKMKKGDEEW